MNQELSIQLTCPCNGKCYKNKAALKTHHKTNTHIAWESKKTQRDEIIKINKLENEIGHLKRMNNILVERIMELEKTP